MDRVEGHTVRCAEVFLIEDDILHVKYFKGIHLVVQDILDVQNVRLNLIDKKPFYTILDGSAGKINATNEARAWMSTNKESAQFRLMDVMLVKGMPTRLKVSAYLSMFKPIVPTKIVTTFEKAMEDIVADRAKRKN